WLQECRSAEEIAARLSKMLDQGLRDPIVLACRAFPPLASAAGLPKRINGVLAETLTASKDGDIGRRAGLAMPRATRRNDVLSVRELEVGELLVAGRTNREIASALFISESTAKVHVRHIYEKLGVHSRAEAAGLLANNGR